MVFSRNFSLDLEDIILRNLLCFVCCPTFFPQSTVDGSRYLPSSTSVLHSTRSIMLSYSIDYLFRSGSRDQHSTGCTLSSWVGHKQFTTVGPSRSVLLCVPEWLKDRCLDLSSTSSTPPTSRSWSNRSGSVSICTRMIRSSMDLAWYRRRAGLAGRAVRVVNEIKNWMSSNRLRLNADKTQFIWLGTGHFLGNRDTQAINTILSSTDVVNNLGVYLDSELTLERQVSKLCQVCYFHLRRLRTVRRSLSKECLRTLVHAFVTSRVDHCNRPPLRIVFISSRPASVRAEFCCSPGSEHRKVQRNLGCHP